MRNPYIAVEAATDLRARARALRRSWERSMGGESAADVRPVIERSWKRLTGAGLDPEHLHPRPAFERSALEEMRVASPLHHVIETLRGYLGHFADDGEHVMIVVDATGRVLWLEGHPRVISSAARLPLQEGMDWTEESAGTNAIGTALAIEHAVQIFSAEHFLPDQHPWWCSAAPIRDPVTGELAGIADLSGPMRTAHPHSLALVMAAAGMAEEVLARRHAAADELLRRAFLERAGRGRARSAVVAPDGRVLEARPAGWLGTTVALPCAGRVALAGGHEAEAEPLEGGGWIVHNVHASRTGLGLGVHASAGASLPALRLELLGLGATKMRVDGGPPIPLTGRAAEIAAVLALHPEGLTGEQLTLHLYGDEGNPVSTRAEMTRVRRLLGPCLAARPYRLAADVSADFLAVEHLLELGDLEGAIEAYTGPLLPDSTSPRVVQARNELTDALARAARAGSPAALWGWLHCEDGRDDAIAMSAFVTAVAPDDARHAIVAARLESLQRRWQLPLSAV